MRRQLWIPAVRANVATFATALGIVLLSAMSQVFAQATPELPQPSPKARVEQRVGLTDFVLDYSSPGVKGRKIWGDLVPLDQLWRTGANAPTTLKASRDFTFGGTAVPAGTYSVFTIPGKKIWTVILNTNLKVAATQGYEAKDDVARVSVKPESAPFRERLAFEFADTTDDGTRLDLDWEKLRVSVPITVDTTAQARTNIDKALDDAWRPHFNSARWILDNNGDLTQALGYIDTSIGIKPTWWNNWVKAQILAKQGHTAEAIAAAEQAQVLGSSDQIFQGIFKDQVAKAIAEWKKKS